MSTYEGMNVIDDPATMQAQDRLRNRVTAMQANAPEGAMAVGIRISSEHPFYVYAGGASDEPADLLVALSRST